jgi:hypothetical protein
MLKNLSMALLVGGYIFGALSTSPHYDLNNYSIGAGGASNSSDGTYSSQASLGEQAVGKTSNTPLTGNSGSIQSQQLSVPLAPTITNNSSIDYNKLQITLSDTAGSSNYPTDTTFAIAVSTTSNFTTTYYVQADGSLNTTPVFQTYTTWGGASGSYIIGLTSNQIYYAKVSALEGKFTNTAYGASANATTASPTTTFSVTPNTLSIGSLLPSTIVTSSNLTFGFSTNGASGGAVYVSGAHAGLFSTSENSLISAYSGSLSTPTSGFGVQATNVTQTSGGPFTASSPFNLTGNTVGAETTSLQKFLTSSFPVTSGTANANVQAKASSLTPAALDYQETLTFVASGNF